MSRVSENLGRNTCLVMVRLQRRGGPFVTPARVPAPAWRAIVCSPNCSFVIMEDEVVARKAIRPVAGPGDDVGAAELGRRVAENLRQRRKGRGMSLDDLARASGVSRAALSQVETLKSNPTLGLLWKIAVGLGIPMAELIGQRGKSSAAVLRRKDAQVLRSLDGKLESRPLTPAGASPLVELYELKLSARATHVSEPHAPGTREIVV